MQLKIFRHLWGTDLGFAEAIARFMAAGYSGIECRIPPADAIDACRSLLVDSGMEFIAMAFTDGDTPQAHAASLREQATFARALGARSITCHSGQDCWSHRQAEAYFTEALFIESDIGITIAHETHRGRYFYSPWVTAPILERFPNLRLCCDYSHWVCVAERLLGGCDDILALCAERCSHLHARVGYEEGPQVPDPRAPEYAPHVAAHERWWDQIWRCQQKSGVAETTLTPEFGPPGYLHTLPYTNAPVADLADICQWQADRQRRRFAEMFG